MEKPTGEGEGEEGAQDTPGADVSSAIVDQTLRCTISLVLMGITVFTALTCLVYIIMQEHFEGRQ